MTLGRYYVMERHTNPVRFEKVIPPSFRVLIESVKAGVRL